MANTYKQLAQAVGTGAAASVFSPAASQTVIVREIRVVNTSASSKTFKLYNHDAGTTYNNTTQIVPNTSLPGDTMFVDKCHICMNVDAGSIGFDGPAELTISLWGLVIT